MTPEHAISAGANFIVVGRPISEADDPVASAKAFTTHIAEALKGG